jgi:hypothetical protein
LLTLHIRAFSMHFIADPKLKDPRHPSCARLNIKWAIAEMPSLAHGFLASAVLADHCTIPL